VDLNLTSDQDLFVKTSRRFIDTAYPLAAVRDGIPVHGTVGADYRRKAAELGWFAMLVPDDLGGGSLSGNGVFDAALVAVARGASLQPGTFVGTNVVAYAVAHGGTADQQSEVLPALVSGEASGTWAFSGAGPGGPAAGVSARRTDAGYVLSGRKTLVQDVDTSDWILVTADTEAGTAQFLLGPALPGVTVHPLDGLDLTRRFGEVEFADAEIPRSALLGETGDAGGLVERQLQLACVLTVAESIGAMEYDLDLVVQYAKDRTAFGRPIGSFQAVKHLLADTSLLLEMSKAVATAAAEAVGEGDARAAEMASMAKAFVGDCAIDLAQNCFQVFGGIGYTWEHDQHLYLRRLTTDAALYGDPAWHRERLCQLSGL
jgi:alkylation response protein AidB-like acyl-CoA dehydrogenase